MKRPSPRHGWKILVFLFLSQAVRADVPPAELTFFGLYGTPVQPLGLAASNADGFGFNLLGEWNASPYVSFGLSFEQVSFYGNRGFTVPALNFESRLFFLQNGKEKFSPYLYGGAGLDLSSDGSPQLKLGLGSRVSLAGPLFFDIAAGSDWIQAPANFQYVDLRMGLSYSIELKETPKTTPTPTPASTVTAKAPVTATPTQAALEVIAPTPLPVISQAPVTTLAEGKKYYKIGMQAFGDGNFPLALKALKKSLTLKEVHKAAYYYAETYATIGVIYQFHAMKIKGHDQKALDNYRKALAIDPTTKSAKHYYKKLKAKLAKAKKTKRKVKSEPAPTGDSTQPSAPSGDSTVPTSSGTPSNYF